MLLQKLFYQRTVLSVGYWDKEGQIKKKLVKSGVQGLMYIKHWFKPMFPLFLTWLFCKLKFPTVISQVMPMLIMLDFILRRPFHLKLETNWASTIHEFVNLRWWEMSKNFSYECDHLPSSGSFKVQSQPEINVFSIIKSDHWIHFSTVCTNFLYQTHSWGDEG